jgi:predicted ribosomally synthesized peptide with SipW-like signal peptide
MTDKKKLALSRRQALAGLGAIGLAGAGAGFGTSALFNDEETFENNSIQAGTLDLVVDYYTSYDFNDPEGDGSDTINGNPADYSYVLTDVKPGDSGTLVFCPKIVDNPGHLFVASADGITNYENGQTEPEEDVDASGGGSLTGGNDGDPNGDLGQEILADVKYVENVTDATTYDEIRTVTTDQTLNGLLADLESGFRVDGVPNDPDTVYPSSSDAGTQNGPCIAIEWELPVTVGNKIQSDAVEFTFSFAAVQSRNNPAPTNPVATVSVGPSGGGYDYNDLSTALSNESDEVIGLAGGETFTLSSGANANASLVPLGFQSMPTVEVDGGQLRLTSNDLTIAGLDIDLLNGGVVYNPNPADGLAFINNDVSISETSSHGIRIEGVGALNAVVANNVFEQRGTPYDTNGEYPQGVLLSDGQNVVISDNEFTTDGSVVEGQAVFVAQGPGDVGATSNIVVSDNSMDGWENGATLIESQADEIFDISITGNNVSHSSNGISQSSSGINPADIWLVDQTDTDGFENINGEDTESAQETALESDNSLTSDGADVVV